MARIILIMALLLNVSFSQPNDDGTAASPSPEGDTRMGADAATTGTDVTDKELQAMEEKVKTDEGQRDPKKEDPSDEEAVHTNVK